MTKKYRLTPEHIYKALIDLQKILLDTLDFDKVIDKVVNAMLFDLGFVELGYKVIVLTLYDEKSKVLKRIALSQTEQAERALKASSVPFREIDIPISASDNFLIRTLKTKKPMVTHYWPDIFRPILSDEDALKNQTAAGIKTSMLFPITVRNQAIGVMIFSMIKSEKEVTEGEKGLIQGFADIVGLSIENSKLFTATKVANEKLKQLDKLKDEFVSIASHELRTPLTAIKGYIWLAINKSPTPLPDQVKKNLQIALDSNEHLAYLVEDMLTISRIEGKRFNMNMEKTDLIPVIDQVYNELAIKAQTKEIEFSVTHEVPNCFIMGDKEKLREIFMNIAGNALKFTPEKGVVKVIIEKKDHEVIISIRDTGPGISKANIPKLFQKFVRLSESYAKTKESGTGLGLYITKQIIELHKGKISIESEVDKGSTFTITFPLV